MINWVSYEQYKFTFHSARRQNIQDQDAEELVSTNWWPHITVYRTESCHCVLPEWKKERISLENILRALIPFIRVLPSWLNSLPKVFTS